MQNVLGAALLLSAPLPSDPLCSLSAVQFNGTCSTMPQCRCAAVWCWLIGLVIKCLIKTIISFVFWLGEVWSTEEIPRLVPPPCKDFFIKPDLSHQVWWCLRVCLTHGNPRSLLHIYVLFSFAVPVHSWESDFETRSNSLYCWRCPSVQWSPLFRYHS